MSNNNDSGSQGTVKHLAETKQKRRTREDRTSDTEPGFIDFISFYEYWEGDLSDETIAQYIYYLDYLDFNPLRKQPEPKVLKETDGFTLEDFKHWAREKARQIHGTSSEDKNKRNRFIKFCYNSLKAYFKAKKQRELIGKLPEPSEIPEPSSTPQKLRVTEEQIEKMLGHAENSNNFNSQDIYAVTLMYYSGCRAKEIIHSNYTWFEFQEDKERIEVEIPGEHAKGQRDNKTPETVYLPWSKKQTLEQHITTVLETDNLEEVKELDVEERRKPLVDFTPNGSEKTFSDVKRERFHLNKMLQDLAEDAGLNIHEEISAHKLRGSFIKQCDDKLDSISRVASQARHSDVKTTQEHYLQRKEERRAEDYEEVFK